MMSKKEIIPKIVKTTVWKRRFGNNGSGKCICCGHNDINNQIFNVDIY